MKLKKSIIGILFVTLLLFISSCTEDVIEIDLSDLSDTIVIEGIISNSPGPHRVRISRARYIFDEWESPIVSNATVTITDDQGNSDVLEEVEQGLYQTNSLTGVPGRTYTLRVIVEGEVYTATSFMPEPIKLDILRFQRISNNTPEYNLNCSFIDREGIEDYCRINFYRNGYLLESDIILYQDNYTDGETIIIDDLDNYFYRFDRVSVEIITLNKNIYEYYSYLENSFAESEDETIDIIELGYANPKSNISNRALGFFSAQSYSSHSGLVR